MMVCVEGVPHQLYTDMEGGIWEVILSCLTVWGQWHKKSHRISLSSSSSFNLLLQ